MNYSEITDAFSNAMLDAGIVIHGAIIADGKIQRAYVEGDKRGTKNLSYCLHLDGRPSGYFEHWGRIKSTWSLSGEREPMTPAMLKQIKEDQAKRQKEQAERHAKAVQTAAYIWRKSSPISHQSEHPYLIAKRIKPHTLRLLGEKLVMPIYSEGRELVSLQFIGPNLDAPDDNKRLLKGGRKKGCFSPIGDCSNVTKLLIAEGYATGASLHESLSLPVLVAIDAGNLAPVAEAARRLFPDAEIIVMGDNDESGKGQNEARKAALAIGGKYLIPTTPGHDWNDVLTTNNREGV